MELLLWLSGFCAGLAVMSGFIGSHGGLRGRR